MNFHVHLLLELFSIIRLPSDGKILKFVVHKIVKILKYIVYKFMVQQNLQIRLHKAFSADLL